MTDRWTTVAAVDSPVEAALIKNLLEGAGIPVFLADEDTVATAWHLAGAMGGIKVQVAQPDALRARSLLRQHRPPAAPEADEPETATGNGRTREAEDEEEKLSPREQDANRALRASLVGLLVPPVQLYASWLLVKVWSGRQPLTGPSRRNAWVAAGINGAVLGACALMVAAIVLGKPGDPRDRLNLRQFRHPERMVGVWQGRLPADAGVLVDELELQADGRMRYRCLGQPLEGLGTWGYENNWFLFRVDRVVQGELPIRGKTITYRLASLTDDVMTVETGRGTVHWLRKGSAEARQAGLDGMP